MLAIVLNILHLLIFFREKNLDTVTIIDATHMQIRNQWKGRCINSTSDLGSIYTFVFSPNPYKPSRGNCYYCVRFFARTVNVIEKIESKFFKVNGLQISKRESIIFRYRIYINRIIWIPSFLSIHKLYIRLT